MQKDNTALIDEYVQSMIVEVNPSKGHLDNNKLILSNLSKINKDKPFIKMKREDIITYLNSLRKSEKADPLHKWIGTYNNYLLIIKRFFKWIHNPTLSPKQRPDPKVIQNLNKIRRKEQSIYKPTDLWTREDDLLFLKYCPSTRDRCYHVISRDTSARPNEILGLKNKDIIFKDASGKQYAEVLVSGKTGTRHVPLIDSIPYIKEWLDQHPARNNPEAYFICSSAKRNFAGKLTRFGLFNNYKRYYEIKYFPDLLKNPDVPAEDKDRIRELLKKPWNPYIRRHSALTDKSKFLKEHTLRQHAGWSGRSQMHLKYLHYFGNESNNSILQEYGILPKENEEENVLTPKICPNCNEPNRPDQKFCSKCKLALTYEAWEEKEDEVYALKNQVSAIEQQQKEVLEILANLTTEKVKEIVEAP